MSLENVRSLRRAKRHMLVLPARCRSRSGFVDHVVISDLSEGGCRIDSLGLVLGVGDMVVVRPQALEGLTGVIRWTKGHSAGIEFDRPLYGPVVEHLQRAFTRFLDPAKLQVCDGRLRLAA